MGTGMLATIGDTPKTPKLSEAKESEQACRTIPPESWALPTLNFIPPWSNERVDGGTIARLPGTENLHCRRYAMGP
jgi:hypothetical protein